MLPFLQFAAAVGLRELLEGRYLNRMRWTICTVRKVTGLDDHFDLVRKEDLEFALAVCKEKIVAARRAGDDDTAAEMSCAKAFLVKRYNNRVSRTCPVCGEAKASHSQHCQVCYRTNRFFKNKLMESTPIKEHEIETELVIVTSIRQAKGDLARIIDKLAEDGQVGDSFVSSKQSTTITTLARMRGLKVICRMVNPDENHPKGKKFRRYRVWRCDGLDMDAVNEIIRKRLANEPVPEPEPVVRPTAEELEALKHARWGNRSFTGGRPTNESKEEAPPVTRNKKRQGAAAAGAAK